jgi:hypothetical protein
LQARHKPPAAQKTPAAAVVAEFKIIAQAIHMLSKVRISRPSISHSRPKLLTYRRPADDNYSGARAVSGLLYRLRFEKLHGRDAAR